jgi:hypothetical protein
MTRGEFGQLGHLVIWSFGGPDGRAASGSVGLKAGEGMWMPR